MKAKFFLVLILLIAVGGTGFYFGWIQFQLPAHTYGVIYTKTGGWDSRAVEPGTFNWRWERLIPTNMTLYRIPLRPQTVDVSQEGTLPSGDVYASVLENKGDFTYSLEFSLSYQLKKELLPELVQEKGLEPEKLDSWYEGLNRQIMASVTEIVEDEAEAVDESDSADLAFGKLEETLLAGLSEDFTYVDFEAVQPKKIDVPDPDLYRSAKEYYLGVLEKREQIERETLEQERSWMVSEESRLQVLERYGKLFTDYPGLVRYFALQESEEFKDLLPPVDLLKSESGGAEQSSTENTGETENQ